jgi:general secretion pathway protein D
MFQGTAGGTSGSAGTLSGASGLGTSQSGAAVSRVGPASTTAQGARIIADELNNAVLVYSLPSEYAKIETTLKRLDLAPTQVLIEASIIEVTLGDDLQYGLQWYFTDKARNGLVGTGVLSTVADGVLGPALAGFSYTLKNSLGQVRAVLNALAEKSLVKVISSPSLMVLDNHSAGIAVGNQQPIRTGETVTTGGNVTTSIQYKDTGVNLQVTPSVSAENIVTMSINQAVTDVGQIDTATGQRSFLQRQIVSKVAVRSGETLVLGGLIRDNDTSGKSGLPLLSEIPVVGALFGTHTRNASRTELLVVITPRVVRSDIDAREIGEELRERMKSFPGHGMNPRP